MYVSKNSMWKILKFFRTKQNKGYGSCFSIGYGSRSKKGSIYPAATRRPNVWISELSVCLTGYPVQKSSPPVLLRCRCPLPRMTEADSGHLQWRWVSSGYSCLFRRLPFFSFLLNPFHVFFFLVCRWFRDLVFSSNTTNVLDVLFLFSRIFSPVQM